MTSEPPRGSGAPPSAAGSRSAGLPRVPAEANGPVQPRAAVALVSATWAGPSRPAPTVLRELARRWDGAVHSLLVEDPPDELLEAWQIDALPTWLRFQPGVEPARRAVETRGGDDGPEDPLVVPELRGFGPDGAALTLPGPWTLTHRGPVHSRSMSSRRSSARTRTSRRRAAPARPPARLHGCTAARLHGCTAARLHGCTAARLHGPAWAGTSPAEYRRRPSARSWFQGDVGAPCQVP
ncbi:hypothetical protein FM106_06380 [Brachybacterium faecium]|nr:hypothetical protein FM106_06380 [Brachybacterium faecium]